MNMLADAGLDNGGDKKKKKGGKRQKERRRKERRFIYLQHLFSLYPVFMVDRRSHSRFRQHPSASACLSFAIFAVSEAL